jgi:hypothetical protein
VSWLIISPVVKSKLIAASFYQICGYGRSALIFYTRELTNELKSEDMQQEAIEVGMTSSVSFAGVPVFIRCSPRSNGEVYSGEGTNTTMSMGTTFDNYPRKLPSISRKRSVSCCLVFIQKP